MKSSWDPAETLLVLFNYFPEVLKTEATGVIPMPGKQFKYAFVDCEKEGQ